MASGCESKGDADLYGLGVRTGSYISWLTTIVAFHRWPDKTIDSLAANCIFQFSLLVATVYKIATQTAHTGEVFLMTVFGVGGGFAIMIETLVEKRSRGFGSTKLAEILRSLLLLSYSVLGVWFWYSGRRILLLASCNWRVFFFGPTSIHGWFRIFSQCLSIIVLVANTVRIFYMVLGVWVNRCEIRNWLLLASTSPKVRVQRGRNMLVLLVMQTSSFAIFAIMIELFLAWNQVGDVNSLRSAGQLIPLVTALTGLCTVCLSHTSRT